MNRSKTYRYSFRVTFRNGATRDGDYSVTTSEREARRDVWCGLESLGMEPQRTVRRIDLISKTQEELIGADAL